MVFTWLLLHFETCFISTAHDEKAITRTIEVLTEGIRKIKTIPGL